MQLNLPSVGSISFIGHAMNLQSTLVRQLTAQILMDGGSTVFLVDYESEGREAENGLRDVIRAKGGSADAMERYSFIHNVRQYRTSDELQAKIEERPRHVKHKPIVIVRDLGCATLDLLPGASWLSEAEELAVLMDCLVLTAGQYGPAPRPAEDPLKYRADEVWVCEAGLNLALKLRRHKPSDATVTLKGKVMPYGVIAFSNVENMEFAR